MERGSDSLDYRSLIVAAAIAALMAFYQAQTQPSPAQFTADMAGLVAN
jgi:hypothetical protein